MSRSNKIKTIIFDYDGTLHNTKKVYGEAFRYAYSWLVDEGYAKERFYRDREVSKYLGMTASQMWDDFMPDLPSEIKSQVSKRLGSRMDELIYEGYAELYKDIPELLDNLKADGYCLLILSNCRHAYLEAHKSVFKLDKWFNGYYAAEDYDFIPKEEIFKRIRDEWPGDYVVVGDRASDIKVSEGSDIQSIGCLYGFGSPEELISADYLINNPSEINEILDYI